MTEVDSSILADRHASNWPYLIAIGIMSLLTVVFALGVLQLRPNHPDNMNLITLIVIGFSTVTGSLLTFLKAHATESTVNSRAGATKKQQDEMSALLQKLAYAEGIAAARPVAPTPVVIVPPVAAPASVTIQNGPTTPGPAILSGDAVKVEKEK